ncbi:PEP-CTERM sorting domain-containing protein [Adhaeretor mobilis]|uniref:PEP-CTERM protein-sorting domain-containing protein n=1 Tax=Adhaeretor mobilis TaxID=1930276 RepID=A0A517MZB8_9BACT|nr:PEP-CTERM sorting domain-containing protein [Adhaeretor mobilis]QDT00229.1 hypothetical protein HG15A2_35650 [Adhaeretor mobilis]
MRFMPYIVHHVPLVVVAFALAVPIGSFVADPVQAALLTRTWNGADANWTVNAQWAPTGFPNNGTTNTFHAIISAGTPALNQNITLDQLTLNGGAIAGTQNLTVLNSTLWSGGELTGTGLTTLGGAATLNGDAKYLTNRRQVVSNGTTNFSGGDLYVNAPGDAGLAPTWTNNGTFNAIDEADIVLQDFGGTRPRFTNAATGIFNKSGVGTETYISTEFHNAGTVNVNSGILALVGGGTDNGSYTLSPLTELTFHGGDRMLTAASSISGTGNIGVYGGAVTINGALNMSGAAQLLAQGGSIDVNGTFTAPNTITVSGGGAIFNTAPFTMAGPVTLSSGSLGGSANMALNGGFDWSGGELTGTGTTTLSGTTTLNESEKYLTDRRQVVSNGTTTLSGGSLNMYAPGDDGLAPTWTNNGTFNATDEADIVLQDFGGSRPRFTNAATGIYNKSGVGTETYISTEFHNAGTVHINSGYLSLYDGADSGSYTLASSTELNFYGGDRTLSATSSISGTGNVGVYGGTVTVDGALNLSAAGQLLVQGGSLGINGSARTIAVPVTLSSGSLGGSANMALNGGFDWSGGELTGTGTTTLSGTTTLNESEKYLTDRRQVVSNGTTTLSGGSLNMYAPGDDGLAPTWTNNGTFNATDEADIVLQDFGGSRPRFTNAATGIYNKSGVGTETYISTVFHNAGKISVNSGRLNLAGQYTQTAGSLQLKGGAVTAGLPLDIQGGSLTGTGTITGDVASNGLISPGLSAGSLVIAGDLSVGPNSIFEFEIGGLTQGTQYDYVTEAGAAQLSLDGLLSLSLINGFIPSHAQSFAVLRSNTTLTGSFDNVASGNRLTTSDGSGSFRVRYGAGAPNTSRVTLSNFFLTGDFDQDNDVDGNDFLIWQRGGSPNGIHSSDLAFWKSQFGSVTALTAVIHTVPEPSSLVLVAGGMSSLILLRKRRLSE